MEMITVMYTCHACGLQGVKVRVPARKPGQDILEWMPMVAQRCGNNHAFYSPTCRAGKVDLAIPLPENEKDSIGVIAKEIPAETKTPDFMKSKGVN